MGMGGNSSVFMSYLINFPLSDAEAGESKTTKLTVTQRVRSVLQILIKSLQLSVEIKLH